MATQIQIPFTPNPDSSNPDQLPPGKRGRPMLFQISDPVGTPLFPFLLALHVNPQSFGEKMQKSKNATSTFGGYVEFVWPEDLDVISASATTGAFIGPDTGLVAGTEGLDVRSGSVTGGRRKTIAWERQEDLLDLFRNNGIVYSPQGLPILRGRVMCIYDRGIFQGHFTTFEVSETDEKPFQFDLDWEFKVERVIYAFPQVTTPDPLSTVVGTKVAPAPGTQPGNLSSGLKPVPDASPAFFGDSGTILNPSDLA